MVRFVTRRIGGRFGQSNYFKKNFEGKYRRYAGRVNMARRLIQRAYKKRYARLNSASGCVTRFVRKLQMVRRRRIVRRKNIIRKRINYRRTSNRAIVKLRRVLPVEITNVIKKYL